MTYVQVHVHEDGDTELTRVNLSDQTAQEAQDLLFNLKEIEEGKLFNELTSYGIEEHDVAEALTYILQVEFNESCTIGKL